MFFCVSMTWDEQETAPIRFRGVGRSLQDTHLAAASLARYQETERFVILEIDEQPTSPNRSARVGAPLLLFDGHGRTLRPEDPVARHARNHAGSVAPRSPCRTSAWICKPEVTGSIPVRSIAVRKPPRSRVMMFPNGFSFDSSREALD